MSKTICRAEAQVIFSSYNQEAVDLCESLGQQAKDSKEAGLYLAEMCRSIDEVVVTLVNLTNGAIDAGLVTSYLTRIFPDHRIGERHGPHYLSLCRTGKIGGRLALGAAPATKRVAKPKVEEAKGVIDLSAMTAEQLQALAEMVEAAKADRE